MVGRLSKAGERREIEVGALRRVFSGVCSGTSGLFAPGLRGAGFGPSTE